ncbi:hypothetical protein, partial [Pseudomonas sp. SDO558_S425]
HKKILNDQCANIDGCEEDARGLLRTHLYLYIQAYAIKRPTLRARFEDFSGTRVEALENKASQHDEFSYGGFLQCGRLVIEAGLCAMLGRSVTSWCGKRETKCGGRNPHLFKRRQSIR